MKKKREREAHVIFVKVLVDGVGGAGGKGSIRTAAPTLRNF